MRIIYVLLFFLSFTAVATAQGISSGSAWKNQRGSEFIVTSVDVQGKLVGQYVNNATGFECQGVPFDVFGTTTGSHVWFAVIWKNATMTCNSLTVWRGRVAGKKIRTAWELFYIDQKGVVRKLIGRDTFTKSN
jgi:Avidin family